MRIHFIAIGGAAMHNLALALHQNGHQVSGSDDEIYNPARDRLASAGLLPDAFGWFPEKLNRSLDAVVLGMHARADNPELLQAQALGLPVYSYPAFMVEQSREKKRYVVAGSHGKTTTTAMAMHCLRKAGYDFDYLVGAQVQGFDTMVRLSAAPALLVEGDEYFASPLDHTPKMVRFKPHFAVITGIAWDHINVFPSFKDYVAQFDLLVEAIESGGSLAWYADDPELRQLVERHAGARWRSLPFEPFPARVERGHTLIDRPGKEPVSLQIFGRHNLLNAKAASLICQDFGMNESDFLLHLSDF
ncbi:MAG: Mur ligase family protein, partial [Saprospiraceae bacterium]|nr:Mur ligase family protein [Saprospiraceae bacterium]